MLSWIAVITGFVLLVWSADRFVFGAAATAQNLGISPLIIGMTIMGFGTSAPELVVSVIASLNGNAGLAIGNAIGSNIANIAMVLGTSALVAPLSVDSNLLRREFPILLLITFTVFAFMWGGKLTRIDGAIFLTCFIILILWMIYIGSQSRRTDPMATEFDAEIPHAVAMRKALFWVTIGLIMLLLSSRLLVWGAVVIAKSLGVSDLFIGLTIVAIGTSLPEMAASIMGTLKGEHEIALGNVLGSNMFNLLAVLGVSGVIGPGEISPEVLERDFPVMIGFSIALFLMAYGFRGPGRINRIEGGILVLGFSGYLTLLYLTST